MIHKEKNYCYKDPECSDGDEFVRCNLTQVMPFTEICKGKTDLTFTNCNLVNCKLPQGVKATGCNITQVSRCSHEHPELVKRGLPVCPDDCGHITSKTEIVCDGVCIDMVVEREDRVR